MRIFLGMILGAVLTVAGAYVYDTNRSDEAGLQRPIVNWDVVSENWRAAKSRVEQELAQISPR